MRSRPPVATSASSPAARPPDDSGPPSAPSTSSNRTAELAPSDLAPRLNVARRGGGGGHPPAVLALNRVGGRGPRRVPSTPASNGPRDAAPIPRLVAPANATANRRPGGDGQGVPPTAGRRGREQRKGVRSRCIASGRPGMDRRNATRPDPVSTTGRWLRGAEPGRAPSRRWRGGPPRTQARRVHSVDPRAARSLGALESRSTAVTTAPLGACGSARFECPAAGVPRQRAPGAAPEAIRHKPPTGDRRPATVASQAALHPSAGAVGPRGRKRGAFIPLTRAPRAVARRGAAPARTPARLHQHVTSHQPSATSHTRPGQ